MKILCLGDKGVGKSVLIKRFCERRFERRYISTIGVDYGSIVVEERTLNDYSLLADSCSKNASDGGARTSGTCTRISNNIHIDFYDLSGDDVFVEVRNEFYDDVDAVFLVLDVTSQQSFENLSKWMDEIRSNGVVRNDTLLLCANKVDLLPRLVLEKQVLDFAKKHKLRCHHTSAAKGSGVDELFTSLFQAAYTRKKR